MAVVHPDELRYNLIHGLSKYEEVDEHVNYYCPAILKL